MPELAEVEYYRKQWEPVRDETVARVEAHARARVFRGCRVAELTAVLPGAVLRESRAHGKQMLFRFDGGGLSAGESGWLGVHLGMSGRLAVEAVPYAAGPHDHLVLWTESQAAVFADPRQFGKVSFAVGRDWPDWWRGLPPGLLEAGFDQEGMAVFLRRRARTPIKAALLLQERFPGIGNWMADEILWRARIHPREPAGGLSRRQEEALFAAIREVCREALEVIGTDWGDPPASWLFPHRWKEGGICPASGRPLARETVGGRTTCWSPARQKLRQRGGGKRKVKK